MSSHLHNMVIHFPVGLGLAGALLVLLAYKWPQCQPGARMTFILAALFAVAAYFTGRNQKQSLEHSTLSSILELHEKLGTATLIGLWVGVLLGEIHKARRWLWIYAIVISLLIAVTEFYGTALAHPR